ncbi:hypothetical protein ATO7_06245 [Oceanococcus atlanticus]|uniref:Uncharacterized protein n=2 Tax=Oceanococcus atlanticus TaxID=1317117 RepID=A0A1Y1SIP9_9GAMM|nr:hypothetical protein ATO7_06245 [Oceanococcus atlanticus]
MNGNRSHGLIAGDMLANLIRKPGTPIEGVLAEVVRRLAGHIFLDGFCHHEIIYKDNQPHLAGFPNTGVVHAMGYVLQFVPPSEWARWNKKVCVIPKADVWRLEVPQALGGHRRQKVATTALTRLHRFRQHRLTPHSGFRHRFVTDEVLGHVRLHNRDQELIFQSTSCWGWMRAGNFNSDVSEFFAVYHGLKFAWAKATLRTHILAEINSLFRRLNLDTACVVHGLATPEHYAELMQRYKARELSTMEARDAAYGLI